MLEVAKISQEVYREDLERLKDCDVEETFINEIPSTKIVCPKKWDFTRCYFQKDDKYFWIELSDTTDLLKAGEPIPELFLPNCWYYFNQILSTFRFLD